MDRNVFNKGKEIENNLNKVNNVIDAIENKTYPDVCFALSVEAVMCRIPLSLTEEMTKDMLEVCYKYKSIYEKQFKEL